MRCAPLVFVVVVGMAQCIPAYAQVDAGGTGSPAASGKPWVEQQLGTSAVSISVPSPLTLESLPLVPGVANAVEEHANYFGDVGDTMIMAVYMRLQAGARIDLDAAVAGAIAALTSEAGVISVEKKTAKESLFGRRAIYVELLIKRGIYRPLHVRGVLFGNGSEFWQVMLSYSDDGDAAGAIWPKLRNSIRQRPSPAKP